MTLQRPMFPPREIETIEQFLADTFCEALLRIERIGSCRRLVFVVTDRGSGQPFHAVTAKLVLPAEALAALAQMIAADCAAPERAFAHTPRGAVAN